MSRHPKGESLNPDALADTRWENGGKNEKSITAAFAKLIEHLVLK